MKYPIGTACILLFLSGACGLGAEEPAQAQDPAPSQVQGQAQPPDPQLKPNPMDVLRAFQPPADEEYRLGRGDEITVDFSGRPELQAKLIVGPDGRITLPLIGAVGVADQTRSEAAKAIETALADYYTNMSVMITVNKYTANRIMLLGSVEHPGMLEFDGTPTLLEVLSRGGISTGPDKISRLPERCAIYRGQDQVVWVELKAMMESGNTTADLRLRRDDVVYVPDVSERFVSVLGEVNRPGAVPVSTSTTLASVLAGAGGFTSRAGSVPHIQIVDPASGASRLLSFKDVLNPAMTLEITLKPGEIVFVPQSGFYHATYFLERLSPLITMASMALVGSHL